MVWRSDYVGYLLFLTSFYAIFWPRPFLFSLNIVSKGRLVVRIVLLCGAIESLQYNQQSWWCLGPDTRRRILQCQLSRARFIFPLPLSHLPPVSLSSAHLGYFGGNFIIHVFAGRKTSSSYQSCLSVSERKIIGRTKNKTSIKVCNLDSVVQIIRNLYWKSDFW